jgi:hypothetical protein
VFVVAPPCLPRSIVRTIIPQKGDSKDVPDDRIQRLRVDDIARSVSAITTTPNLPGFIGVDAPFSSWARRGCRVVGRGDEPVARGAARLT